MSTIDPKALEAAARHFLTESGSRCNMGGCECDELATMRLDRYRACDRCLSSLNPFADWRELPQAPLVRLLAGSES